MEVFKFGGASVKDAQAVQNVARILQDIGDKRKLVVISAMGKTTNALERAINYYVENKTLPLAYLEEIKQFHLDVSTQLFLSTPENLQQKIEAFFKTIIAFLKSNQNWDYNYIYDQIICYGELLSTVIISEYLSFKKIENTWLDARQIIQTDHTYREAKVDWELTKIAIQQEVDRQKLSITQGFIAGSFNNNSTSLGREGSDYSAGIFAYCLDAKKVCIWKDVDGFFNGDPKIFPNTQVLEQISYREAIELAFYGASIIHPKTLQPLQKKEIPLFIKSFYKPKEVGTLITKGPKIRPKIPCFIVKHNLVLISLSTLDFSFFVEENISEVFALLHHYQVKVDLIQNSAISFSLCVDNRFNLVDDLLLHLKKKYKVSFNKNVSLYTVRHFDNATIASIENVKNILLKQQTRETVQWVTQEKA